MEYGRAFAGGVIGGVLMSIGMEIARMLGVPANLELLLGTMILQPGATAWIVGYLMHLIISGLIGLIYGWGFAHVTHRASAAIGIAFSLVHIVIGGIAMGMLPAAHPLVPEQLPAPGPFMTYLGPMGIFAMVALHVGYGAVVGAVYAGMRRRVAV